MRTSLLPCLLLAALFPAWSQSSDPAHPAPYPAEIATQINAIEQGLLPPVILTGDPHPARSLADEMRKWNVPAVSIAIIHNHQIVWARGYGTVSRGGAPVTPATLFQAASISKSITAMAALHLVQTGRLSLDAPIQTELKSWSLPQNNFTAQQSVTLRELLSHTAGTSVHGFPGYAADAPVPTLKQVLDGARPANTDPITVTSRPGQAFSYSGGGFTIVQQLLIDATGTPFPNLMKTLVLDPVGMRNSSFEQPLSPALLTHAALPVDSAGTPLPGGPHTYPEMAAAGLWTTPTDLATWVIEMQRSLEGKANHVLSREMAELMITPVKNNYALGVGLEGSGKNPAFTHTGGNAGYRDIYIGYRDGDGAVIMTNGDNGGAVYSELLRSIARTNRWPDFKAAERTAISLPTANLAPFVGRFNAGDLPGFEILNGQNQLQLRFADIPTTPLSAATANTFFTTESPLPIELRFTSPDAGTFSVGDQVRPFTRVKQARPTDHSY